MFFRKNKKIRNNVTNGSKHFDTLVRVAEGEKNTTLDKNAIKLIVSTQDESVVKDFEIAKSTRDTWLKLRTKYIISKVDASREKRKQKQIFAEKYLNKKPKVVKVRTAKKQAQFNLGSYFGSDVKRREFLERHVGEGTMQPTAWRYSAPIIIIFLILLSSFSTLGVRAATRSLNQKDILDGTTSYNTIDQSVPGQISLQKGNLGTWSGDSGLQELPVNIYNDSELVYGPNKSLYLLTSFYNSTKLLKYDIDTNKWVYLANPPGAIDKGTTMVFDNFDNFYVLPGGGTARFYRYTLSNNNWTVMPNLPMTVNTGAKAAFVPTSGGSIYTFRGGSSSSFWRYDISSGTWESKANFTNISTLLYGADLTWDGANTIYAINNVYNEFRKYSISGNSWTSLPASPRSSTKNRLVRIDQNTILSVQLAVWTETSYLSKYNAITNSWSSLPSPPSGQVYDFAVLGAYDGTDNLYTLFGTDTKPILYKYSVSSNTWNTLYSLYTEPNGFWHERLVYDGGQFAYFQTGTWSGTLDKLVKLDLNTGAKSVIGAYPPVGSKPGFAGVYNRNTDSLYFFGAINSSDFYSFDLASNTWSVLPITPAVITWGADIIDGDDGYLYSMFGNTKSMYRYNLSSNTWENLNPTNVNSAPNTLYVGGGLTRIGRTIYVLAGNYTGYFQKYDIDSAATNKWTNMLKTPVGGIQHGGAVTSDGTRYIYITPSNYTETNAGQFYRYDIVLGTWERLADLPSNNYQRASMFYNPNNSRVYVAPGANLPNLWYWTATNNAYVARGEWYSKTFDLTQAQSWSNITASVSGPATGTVNIYTRTSDLGNIWSDWQLTSGDNIRSTAKRFLQIKAELIASGNNSPTLSDISFDYTQESVPPSLPSQVQVYGNSDKAQTLVSGQPYEYQHPYFEWNGSTDGVNGSGIDGYYVYYGNNNSADPIVDGNFQTAANYTATSSMTNGTIYYLRVKVKDKLGNISNGTQLFSYQYRYISPPGTELASTFNQYAQGLNTDVDLGSTPDAIKLAKNNNGSWSLGPSAMLPATMNGGSSVYAKKNLYVLRGATTTTFWRYDTERLIWSNLAPAPDTIAAGSAMTWDGNNYLYALRGGSTNTIYRYSILSDTWVPYVTTSAVSAAGTDIKYIGNNRFVVIYGTGDYYMYDITSNIWTSLPSVPLVSAGCGGPNNGVGLHYDGNDTVYAYMGSSDCGGKGFSKYIVSLGYWTTLTQPAGQYSYLAQNLVDDGQGNLYIFGQDMVRYATTLAQKYNIASNSWSDIPNAYAESTYGTLASDGFRYIYHLPGSGSNQRMVRYDTWDKVFSPSGHEPTSLPTLRDDNAYFWSAGNAATTAYDGDDNLFLLGGNEGSSPYLAKYSISTRKTSYIQPPPIIGYGGSMVYSNNSLYYLAASSSKEFYRYSFAKRYWERLSDTPGDVSVSVSRPGPKTLIADKDGNLFALRGSSNTAFYKFVPNGLSGTWSTVAAAPGTAYNSSAVYDGTYIYLVRGNGTNNVYRYTVSLDQWAPSNTLPTLPISVSYGSTILYNAGKLYVTIGNSTNNSYILDTNNLAAGWIVGQKTPELFRHGSSAEAVTGNRAFYLAGDGGSPNVWEFIFPTANTSYVGVGTHETPTYRVDGIFDYAGVKASVNLPANTKVEVWSQTSDDNVNWDDWKFVKNVKISSTLLEAKVASTPKKYIKFRYDLYSMDNVYTPTIYNYSFDYYFDIDPPTNPSILSSFTDSSRVNTMSSNTWYHSARPLFDWPDAGEVGGPTDGELGSRIKGYYVYLGSDETASPQTAGQFVSASEFTPDLTTPGVYYLRLQAVDVTGNISPTVFAPFIYKFDNILPENPPFITVTPSGFTSNNNYTFEWPNASDLGGSGVMEYCYRTGANSGAFATERCQTGRTLTDVASAYTQGTNVFYLRTKDVAGNYSASTAEASFYYTQAAPSKVNGLQAIPPISTQNLFSFSWDLPSTFAGDPEQLDYCYSINELPSPTNTTCIPEKYISPFKAGTQFGTNILYMVAKDEAGNVDWNNAQSVTFVANTVSPGIPKNLAITDTSNRSINSWALTTIWQKPTFEGNGVDHYIVERSEDGHTFAAIGTVSNSAYVDISIEPAKAYYYRVRASDAVGNFGGASSIVYKEAMGRYVDPPTIVSNPVVKASFDQAEVTWVTSRASTSFAYYGKTPSTVDQSKGALDLVTTHSVLLTGLTPRTVYYFKVQNFDLERDYDLSRTYSDIFTFRTTDSGNIAQVSVTDIALSSTILNWQTTIPTKAKIEYGKTIDYGLNAEETVGFGLNHILRLTALDNGTTYHFRIIAEAESGGKFYSDDYQFTTIPYPRISGVKFQPVADASSISVEIIWQTNVPTDSIVSIQAPGVNQESAKSELTNNHRLVIDNLSSNTDYTFNIKGRDNYGNMATSEPQKWKSTIDTRAPKISDTSVEINSSGVGSEAKVQLIITWKTDEPSTSQVQYGTGSMGELNKQTAVDPELTTNHVVVISNLELSQIYRLKPVSSDGGGNAGYGEERIAVTQDKEFSILELIIGMLRGIIGD